MGSTIAEKILGAHAGDRAVKAGDVVVADVDFAMLHDARAGNALKMVEKLGAEKLPFAQRTAFVLDHYSPPPHPEAANTHRAMRAFADEHGAVLYDVGDGICHQVLPEGGHFTCGDLVVGTDTHSTTYGAFNAFGTGVADHSALEHDAPWGMNTNNNHYQIDLNRDALALTQRESQAIAAAILRWNPQVFVDHHGETTQFFFPPTALSMNPNLPAAMFRATKPLPTSVCRRRKTDA